MHLEKAIIGGSGRNNTGDYKRVMAKTIQLDTKKLQKLEINSMKIHFIS